MWLIVVLSALTAGAAAQTNTPAKVSVTRGSQSSPATFKAMLAQGADIVRKGSTTGSSVRRMIEDARKSGDIIRVTCLNDKLTQINANLKTARSRYTALQGSVDPGRRAHEFTVLNVLAQKLQVLDREAQQCTGEGLYDTGDTKVVTEIDSDTVPFEDNPSSPPVLLPPVPFTMPPPASDPTGGGEM